MTLRLFVAIPVPEEIGLRLVPLQRDLAGASWRPPENFHLTLRFFGEIDEAKARDLDDELGRIIAAPFEMRLMGTGSFGGREPSAVWAGADAPPALARIASGCEKAARRAGLAPAKRGFKPHVTLAYLHGTTDVEVAAYQQRFGAFETDVFWVDHFAMYSSHGTKRGSRYVEEAVYPLTGTQA
jgi:2'-5' RNA ligase